MSKTQAHILFALNVLLVSNVLHAQQPLITGKVMYAAEPLKGATVSLANETTFTNDRGMFAFRMPGGKYDITISYAGFSDLQQTIQVNENSKNYFEFELMPNGNLEEIVLVGSRSLDRKTNISSTVPVDVFSSRRLAQTAQISLTQMLNVSAPSFNASREVLNEPATLRGLDPDHVLILVNGVRYHNIAWLFAGNLGGQLGRGSVGNDLNSIPFAAIDKIEILRDGAAAQYGSDAVAGVINIRLKKNTGATSVQMHTGRYYEGDGTKWLLGVNHGIALNRKGFLNLSFSHRRQLPTFRGGVYQGTVYYDTTGSNVQEKELLLALDNQLVADSGFNRRSVIDNAGNTKHTSDGLLLNGSYSLHGQKEIHVTATVNSRRLDRANTYRFPKEKSRVNLLLFPNGFQPHSKSNTVDMTFIAGLTAITPRQWHWDFTSSVGINWVKNRLVNTNNDSQTYILGAAAPTSFYTGKDIYRQFTNNINFTKRFMTPYLNLKSLNIGFGGEWRIENYISETGEFASWYNYDPAHYAMGGVGGTSPENTVHQYRHVFGTYVEIESEFTRQLLVNAAARYEYYSDFGGNLAAKLSARYRLSKNVSARASVNNGFRAPSLQQRYYKAIQNSGAIIGGARTLITRGIFPNDDEVIKALNIPSLKAEKTLNASAGIALHMGRFASLTADAYWIQIRDRIVLSGSFERKTGSSLDSILDANPDFDAISRVAFFSNAIHTRTRGIDIVFSAHHNRGQAKWRFDLGANFTRTRVYGSIKTSGRLTANEENSNILLNTEERTKIEYGQPGSKIIGTLTYERQKLKALIRNTRFGKTMMAPLSSNPNRFLTESFSPKLLTDISISYAAGALITVTAGTNNIFNVYPDRLKHYENTAQGSWIYSPEASPFGFNGGYYFLALDLRF